MNSVTQDMAYRQSLMKYAEKFGVGGACRSITGRGRISTSGKPAGTERQSPWPAGPAAPTVTPISTRRMS